MCIQCQSGREPQNAGSATSWTVPRGQRGHRLFGNFSTALARWAMSSAADHNRCASSLLGKRRQQQTSSSFTTVRLPCALLLQATRYNWRASHPPLAVRTWAICGGALTAPRHWAWTTCLTSFQPCVPEHERRGHSRVRRSTVSRGARQSLIFLLSGSQGLRRSIDGSRVSSTMQTSMIHAYQTSSPAGPGIPSALRSPQPCACGRFSTASAPLFASPTQHTRRPQRQCSLRVASTSLDDLSLFQDGSAMPSTSGSSGREAAVKVEDVPLNSEVLAVAMRGATVSPVVHAWCRCLPVAAFAVASPHTTLAERVLTCRQGSLTRL